jgi:hypothetical protein
MGEQEELPIVMVACRRTSSVDPGRQAQSSADRYDQHCDSRTAYKLPSRASGVVTYKCTKCKYVWSVPIGGQFHGI